MDAQALEKLGFSVAESPAGLEVGLELVSGGVLNPLTQRFITEVTLAVVGDRLIPVSPPELVGLSPISLANLHKAGDVEELLADAFNDHVFHMQRRSAELLVLGLEPKMHVETLDLTTQVEIGPYEVRLISDKRGNFRVGSVSREGEPVAEHEGHPLELSEFRERAALVGYLGALLGIEEPQPAAEPTGEAERTAAPVRFAELAEHFGPGAVLPARSAVEILVEVEVNRTRYRFAAARLAGRTFRGLLAGPTGKLWAERFELEEFPGVATLVASALGVTVEAVRFPQAEK